ncbi:MAG: sterol desaturase family protein [Proteobacteria bacterium]|nr:sterol desaturase family protein [Pseudomonadota bacterium]
MEPSKAVSIIDAAVPLFFVLIALEIAVACITRRRVYRLNDSIADLALGAVSQLAGLWTKIPILVGFAVIGEYFSLQSLLGVASIPERALVTESGFDWVAAVWWSAAFVLLDHQYYWGHRFTHQVNLAWAGHVAHHSSEEYNLAVALRQSATQSLFTMWFYFPVAILGFTWFHYVVCMGINLLYQFWVHTRLVGRLGPFEWVMNTPSHHRVHHGRDPKYIDKNHAGVFIVWDRLYKTFQVEEEEPNYGITSPLLSHNPVWSNLQHYAVVWRTFCRARGARDKLRALFGKTGWKPDYTSGAPAPLTRGKGRDKYDPQVPRSIQIYAVAHFGAAVLFMLAVTTRAASAHGLEYWLVVAGALFTVFSFSNVAGMFDRRSWIATAETIRLAFMVVSGIALAATGGMAPLWGWLIAGLGAASLGILASQREQLDKVLLQPGNR